MKHIPIFPTLVVLVAAGIMVRLGFWQIDRLHEKEAMIASYSAAEVDRSAHPWPASGQPRGYSRVVLDCRAAGAVQAEAGRSAAGQTGWAQVAPCVAPGGSRLRVVLGWAAQPAAPAWNGGAVTGTFVPRGRDGVVFADPPLAGLQPTARPDPRDLPNNHLAYAVQWFLFAGAALVIYGLALRKRLGVR